MQCFFLSRLLRLLPSPKLAALVTAVIFAVAHQPNPILVPVTLLWGLAACLLFLRYHNLYTLALAHAILGVTLTITVPGPVNHNMRVGLGYLTYAHTHRTALSAQP
jgi:membrane protease YdiL (CAAX protease family)